MSIINMSTKYEVSGTFHINMKIPAQFSYLMYKICIEHRGELRIKKMKKEELSGAELHQKAPGKTARNACRKRLFANRR